MIFHLLQTHHPNNEATRARALVNVLDSVYVDTWYALLQLQKTSLPGNALENYALGPSVSALAVPFKTYLAYVESCELVSAAGFDDSKDNSACANDL